MKFIRTLWLVAITIAFWPILMFIAAGWLVWCIRGVKSLSGTIEEGVKRWWRWIKAGIKMNIDFINNGINGF